MNYDALGRVVQKTFGGVVPTTAYGAGRPACRTDALDGASFESQYSTTRSTA